MRYLNLQNTVLISLLAMGVAATTGCSSGSDAPNTTGGAGGSSTGASGSTGTAGQSSGSAGATIAGSGGAGTGGAVGAGGAGGSGNSDTGVCAGKGTRVVALADAKVDDFEGAMISPGWSSFSDVMPTPNSFMITQAAGGAVGTAHSGHYMGTGAKTTAKGGYGVGTVYNVAIDKTAMIYCIDISAFDGVTFWAKAGTAGSKVNVNFVLPETNAQKDGGDCVGTGGAGTTVGCYSHPYKAVTLTADWAQYSVAFADAGMGTLPGGGVAKVSNKIQELVWITLDMDWDFSLDEVQFYKGTPPTGPAGGGDAGH
jgi:hypothetical protein